MGMLVEGKWIAEDHAVQPRRDPSGRFQRPDSQFRSWVTADGSSGFAPEAGRYHLYVSLACPWAHRTLIVRKLMGLERAIGLSIVDPLLGEGGWAFSDGPGCIPDSLHGSRFLHEIYLRAQPDFTGRVTVPVLWDKHRATIVNNESAEIVRMFATVFGGLSELPPQARPDFCPKGLEADIDTVRQALYRAVNNGVYRAGFARTQAAHEEAVRELFAALDHWEAVLDKQRYLLGARLTEADWFFFTTLFRFDPVYVGHFKCNLRRLADYPNLWAYTRDLYQTPGVAETCNLVHIKRHYYESHEFINPTRVVPIGPEIDYTEPHGRDRFTSGA